MDPAMKEWMRGEIRALQSKDHWTAEDLKRAQKVLEKGDELRRDHDRQGLVDMLAGLSGYAENEPAADPGGTDPGAWNPGPLLSGLRTAGFDVETKSRVTMPSILRKSSS